jgi:predicted nucleic acid-binding protein
LTELEEGRRHGEDVPEIRIYDWIKIKNVKVPEFIKLIPDLGQGEAEVLALGCDERDSLIIIDDAIARKISRIQKLKFTGTAGVLLRGKKEGYVKEIKSVIKRLKEVGFYLSDELYTATLIAAKGVIPAKAGIQENTGFRVKPGMTNCVRFMSSCVVVGIFPAVNNHLINACQFFQFHIDRVLPRCFQHFPNIISLNGQLSMSSINEHCQFDAAGPAQVQQRIDGCPDRSPCEEDIVNQKDVFILDRKMDLRLFDLGRLAQPGPIIPIEGNIDNPCGKINPLFLKKFLPQSLCQKDTPCSNPH